MEEPLPTVTQTQLEFVLQYGELASHWGLNKTESQIHGLLFTSEQPLNAEEIGKTLSVGRSHVGQSIKELLSWGLIRPMHRRGDRSEYYEAKKDVWELFRIAVNEQKRREIDPVVRMLDKFAMDLRDEGPKGAHAQKQVAAMLDFFKALTTWYEQMNKLPVPVIKTFLKTGSKLTRLLPK